MDGSVSPMLCSPGRELPAGEGWVLEPKWGGIRAIAQMTEAGPRLFTRHGRGDHHRFPRINAALAELPVGSACARRRGMVSEREAQTESRTAEPRDVPALAGR